MSSLYSHVLHLCFHSADAHCQYEMALCVQWLPPRLRIRKLEGRPLLPFLVGATFPITSPPPSQVVDFTSPISRIQKVEWLCGNMTCDWEGQEDEMTINLIFLKYYFHCILFHLIVISQWNKHYHSHFTRKLRPRETCLLTKSLSNWSLFCLTTKTLLFHCTIQLTPLKVFKKRPTSPSHVICKWLNH